MSSKVGSSIIKGILEVCINPRKADQTATTQLSNRNYDQQYVSRSLSDFVQTLISRVSVGENAVASEEEYIFTPTQDWFSFNRETWRQLFHYVTSSAPRVLEIGSWEGRSAVFLLTELCTQGGSIVCIDHFDLMDTEAGRERYKKLTHNLQLTGKPFRIIDEFSVPGLMQLLREEISLADAGFDWVYVDGSHKADDTFLDAELAWRLARDGAIFIFDDYDWNQQPKDSIHHPKPGIDAFMLLHQGQFEVLSSPTQYQMVLRKTVKMHIGFLIKGTKSTAHEDAFGYGIHVALAIDSTYAMPTAVAIRSTLMHTKGRITFYIVDLGLSEADRDRIQDVVSGVADTTLQFLNLPEKSLHTSMGPTWAKISAIPILPVERVLYLDADVLVKKDMRALWETDLMGKSLGAVSDVGYPLGHAGIERAPYFNAGVLLMDLARVRAKYPELERLATDKKHSTYHDQDALNTLFRDEWLSLDLRWNAQGLGTYADSPSPDREKLDLASMKSNPYIVHFTGPVDPPMDKVINPWVQPYTAKPWGYAGAPNHPYGEEWWKVLNDTPWKGWRETDEFRKLCIAAEEKATQEGIKAFRQRIAEVGATQWKNGC